MSKKLIKMSSIFTGKNTEMMDDFNNHTLVNGEYEPQDLLWRMLKDIYLVGALGGLKTDPIVYVQVILNYYRDNVFIDDVNEFYEAIEIDDKYMEDIDNV